MSIFCTGILLSKSGLASNISPLLFSLSCSISEEFSLIWHFLPANFPLLRFHPFGHNHLPNLHSYFLFPNSSGCIHREQWQCWHSCSQLVFLELDSGKVQISLPELALHISLLHFDLCPPIPSLNYPLSQNVTWVYLWETRRQHSYALCCLFTNQVTGCAGRTLIHSVNVT